MKNYSLIKKLWPRLSTKQKSLVEDRGTVKETSGIESGLSGQRVHLSVDDYSYNGQKTDFSLVKQSGSHEQQTEETRAAFAAEKARLDGIIKEISLWSPLDPPEYTIVGPDGRKVNTKNKNFVQIAFDLNSLYKNHDGKKKLAKDLGLNLETARKKEIKVINKDKPFPTTPLPADDRLAALMGGDLSRKVYVHVTLDRGRWYPLDMDKHDTYAAAIEEVRWKSQGEAWRKAGVPSRRTDTRTIEDNPALARAFKEVVVRYEEAFNPKNLFILDLRSPTVAAFAEIEWEEQGTKYQSGAIGEGGDQ